MTTVTRKQTDTGARISGSGSMNLILTSFSIVPWRTHSFPCFLEQRWGRGSVYELECVYEAMKTLILSDKGDLFLFQ